MQINGRVDSSYNTPYAMVTFKIADLKNSGFTQFRVTGNQGMYYRIDSGGYNYPSLGTWIDIPNSGTNISICYYTYGSKDTGQGTLQFM